MSPRTILAISLVAAGGAVRTLVCASLGVAVDYPADWTAREERPGAVFTSPIGGTIFLARVDTGGLDPEEFLNERMLPNTRCSWREGEHGTRVRLCLDTIARSRSADLILKSEGGRGRLFSLWTRGLGHEEPFQAMAASVRPAP